jgi:hypothetical protein
MGLAATVSAEKANKTDLLPIEPMLDALRGAGTAKLLVGCVASSDFRFLARRRQNDDVKIPGDGWQRLWPDSAENGEHLPDLPCLANDRETPRTS